MEAIDEHPPKAFRHLNQLRKCDLLTDRLKASEFATASIKSYPFGHSRNWVILLHQVPLSRPLIRLKLDLRQDTHVAKQQ